MKIGVIQFPGTNCARETVMAVERAGMEAVLLRWNGDHAELRSLDGYILAGGFSYEDRSRSGVIAAMDPVMEEIARESTRGKPVLGICNGAQILVESGLVPGRAGIALTTNKRVVGNRIVGTGFYNAWVTLRAEPDGPGRDIFTAEIPEGELLRVPAAHAEGRFVMSADTLREIESNGLVAFRYCDEAGYADAEFPVNPNGSVANIAALTNYAGNVMAIMPHPERTPRGDGLFRSLRRYLEARSADSTIPWPEVSQGQTIPSAPVLDPDRLPVFKPLAGSREIIVKLIITDNAAVSVENALNQRGVTASVRRHVHWEILLDSTLAERDREDLLQRIHAAGELYNDNKEIPVSLFGEGAEDTHTRTFLVREKDDIEGRRVHQALLEWFGCDGLVEVKRGVLWTIRTQERLRDLHIVINPTAQEGFHYARRV